MSATQSRIQREVTSHAQTQAPNLESLDVAIPEADTKASIPTESASMLSTYYHSWSLHTSSIQGIIRHVLRISFAGVLGYIASISSLERRRQELRTLNLAEISALCAIYLDHSGTKGRRSGSYNFLRNPSIRQSFNPSGFTTVLNISMSVRTSSSLCSVREGRNIHTSIASITSSARDVQQYV